MHRSICTLFALAVFAGCGAGEVSREGNEQEDSDNGTNVSDKSLPSAEATEKISKKNVPLSQDLIAAELVPEGYENPSIPQALSKGAKKTFDDLSFEAKFAYYKTTPVSATEENYQRTVAARDSFENQILYANKLLLKECVLEAYELESNLLELPYTLPQSTRQSLGNILASKKLALKHCQDMLDSIKIVRAVNSGLKQAYMTNTSWTLADIYGLLTQYKVLSDGIQYLERRHKAVHLLVFLNESIQVDANKTGGETRFSTTRLWIEAHPYWLHKEYNTRPKYGDLLESVHRSSSLHKRNDIAILELLYSPEEKSLYSKLRSDLQKKTAKCRTRHVRSRFKSN